MRIMTQPAADKDDSRKFPNHAMEMSYYNIYPLYICNAFKPCKPQAYILIITKTIIYIRLHSLLHIWLLVKLGYFAPRARFFAFIADKFASGNRQIQIYYIMHLGLGVVIFFRI